MAFIVNDDFLTKIKNDFISLLSYAKYMADGVWYTSELESAEIISTGQIQVTFLIDFAACGGATVTNIELYDVDDTLVGQAEVNLEAASVLSGSLYYCKFALYQIITDTE